MKIFERFLDSLYSVKKTPNQRVDNGQFTNLRRQHIYNKDPSRGKEGVDAIEISDPVNDRHKHAGLYDGQRDLAQKLGQTESRQTIMAELPLTINDLDFLGDYKNIEILI